MVQDLLQVVNFVCQASTAMKVLNALVKTMAADNLVLDSGCEVLGGLFHGGEGRARRFPDDFDPLEVEMLRASLRLATRRMYLAAKTVIELNSPQDKPPSSRNRDDA